MAKRSGAPEPDAFYLSLPSTEADPFSEISSEIEDLHEATNYDDFCGLSDEQVSRIARDSLEQAHPAPKDSDDPSHTLFTPDEPHD